MKPKLIICLSFVLLVSIVLTPSFAFPNKINLQLRTYTLIIPSYGIGLPLANGDSFEIDYSNFRFFKDYTYITLVYSKLINESENEKTAFNIGAIFYNYGAGGGFWFGPNTTSSPGSGIMPVLLYEQERMINNNVSWMINFGIPNLVGLGLKYYL